MHILYKDNKIQKYPYSIDQLKADNPQTSFPSEISDQLLAEWYVYRVETTTKPQADYTKNVLELDPILNEGVWTQQWSVVDATQSEIDQRTAEEAESVRMIRNDLLIACDWTQLKDSPDSLIVWQPYRQALRDITNQPGFPWNVEWPTQPS